mmetsp:Transcript_54183/g.106006  ORF Transcript_54183/g.106006 Transcript_54183/m.106006 type:complete len:419 (+) Transcript_54183:502-1758(+)
MRTVHAEITTALQLQDSPRRKRSHCRIAKRQRVMLAVHVCDVLNFVLLLRLLLGDQMVELLEDCGNQLVRQLGHPVEFLFCLLEVALKMQPALHRGDFSVGIPTDFVNKAVAPPHQGDLLSLRTRSRVILFQQDLITVQLETLAHLRIFLVQRSHLSLNARGSSRKAKGHRIVCTHSHEPGGNRINHLFILRPNFVPLHQVSGPGGPLLFDEIEETLHRQTPPRHSSHGGESGVLPRLYAPFLAVHKPLKFPLGQNGVHQIQTGELDHLHCTKSAGLENPHVLFVPVNILRGPHRMGHALLRIHNRTGKVVARIGLVLCSRSMVSIRHVTPVHDGVPHALVVVLHVNLRPHTAGHALCASSLHLLPKTQILLGAVIATLALYSLPALVSHLFHRGVVDVHDPLLDQLRHEIQKIGKVI